MQIDGHHTLTYVAARIAGFTHLEAEKVAYAAQYVDDATNKGAIKFENSEYMYARTASAHKMIDYNNLLDIENHLVWLPFHFLPGNDGIALGLNEHCDETMKLICRPDSHVARDMLRAAVRDRGTKRELHRLGIAMHVYADTFTHQGFIGALNKANFASAVSSGSKDVDNSIKSATNLEFLQIAFSKAKALFQLFLVSFKLMIIERKSPFKFWKDFLNNIPLGHASVNTYPDIPYINWEYKDWRGIKVNRDNTSIFLLAMDMMVKAMRAWRTGDNTMNLENQQGLGSHDAKVSEELFRNLTDPCGEIRHAKWLDAIKTGRFSFGSQSLSYIAKGEGSWKHIALGTAKEKDSGLESFTYNETFLNSDWKLFHDALQIHRIDVVHEILPRYGICAA